MNTDPGDLHPAMSEANEDGPVMPSGDGQKSSWPTVIGIIGIVIACMYLLGAGCLFLTDAFTPLMPEEYQEQMTQAVTTEHMIIGGILELALGIWLLIGSISLMKHSPSSRRTLNTWAIAAIIWTVVSVVWTMYDITASESASESASASASASASESESASASDQDASTGEGDSQVQALQGVSPMIGSICGGIFSIVWPIVMLCFLNSQRQKEEVASWSRGSGSQ